MTQNVVFGDPTGRWDGRSPFLALLGALVGGGLALFVFGTLQFQPYLVVRWNPWLVRLFVAPLLPAIGAFLACACSHPAPGGWPFARFAAAMGAYMGATLPGIAAYDLLGYLSRYAGATDLLLFVAGPLAVVAALTYGLARWEHKRVMKDAESPPGPVRRKMLRWMALYHIVAVAYGAIAIPQAISTASRAAPYLIMLLPLPFLLFGLGSLRAFRAPIVREQDRAWRDLKEGLVLHLVPLILILYFGVVTLLQLVFRGITYQDPYYQNVVTDPTLLLTPPLALALLGILIYLFTFSRRELTGRGVRQVSRVAEPTVPGLPPWWVSPMGVLIGFFASGAVFFPTTSAALRLLPYFVLPALVGALFRMLWSKSPIAALSAIGTGGGWVLFVLLPVWPLLPGAAPGLTSLHFGGIPVGALLAPVIAVALIRAGELGVTWVALHGLRATSAEDKGPALRGRFSVKQWRLVAMLVVLGLALTPPLGLWAAEGPAPQPQVQLTVTHVSREALCNETITHSQYYHLNFTLHNTGDTPGYVDVAILVDGEIHREETYYVRVSEEPLSEVRMVVEVHDCGDHLIEAVITRVRRA